MISQNMASPSQTVRHEVEKLAKKMVHIQISISERFSGLHCIHNL